MPEKCRQKYAEFWMNLENWYESLTSSQIRQMDDSAVCHMEMSVKGMAKIMAPLPEKDSNLPYVD